MKRLQVPRRLRRLIPSSITTSSSSTAAAAMAGMPKSLRILCFGDSLTYGTNYAADTHPYSIQLEARLRQVLPRTKVSITTNGVPGDMVTWSGFAQRLKDAYQDTHFDWVIVLGGTKEFSTSVAYTQFLPPSDSDLGRGRLSEDIFNALRDVWDIALVKPSKVLALTVPECYARIGWLDSARADLNAAIMQWNERNFYALDIFPKMPYHSLSAEDKKNYWDDGLHFTPAGYDKLGDHVADELIRIIYQEAKPSFSSAPAGYSSRQTDAEVDVEFEEEEDDEAEAETESSRNISQGYVVVRKRDLD
ncbi:SGNH hydrolase-type esterase domain-containing protein [Stachybotrys elegans]|uniref:SGNH hydrolase-type esterase domain-containing protein n=1 Tax=Stachybotrys elegans TaxID=80388 RepID=A0A8K0WWW1_9HYPO|nr:SGNH hydrolase-type esterase domain-containing protein [Stachybotrys elegans]